MPRCLLLLLLLACPACTSNQGPSHKPTSTDITRTASHGPVSLRFTVGPTDLAAAQNATATIEIATQPGVTVPEPDFARKLSEGDHAFEYRVVRTSKDVAKPAPDGKLRSTYRYEIEFVLPGDYELPGVTVSYADARQDSASVPGASTAAPPAPVAPKTETVTTEPISVTVRAPAAVATSPADSQNIKRLDPVELPGPWDRWWWTAPLLAIAALTAVALLIRRSRRQHSETVVVIPAHEWARRQLAALLGEDLLSRGLLQVFYYRISGIVRGYIERRFDVSAPEMTTEEFLAATADDRRFSTETRHELNRFLSACDMVKYARYEPGREESDSVLRAAGEFVERTRERPEDGHDVSAVPVAPVGEQAA